MVERKTDKTDEYFDMIVQKLRRGRLRIAPDLVPGLCAWLMLHARRYERHLNRFATIDGSRADKQIKGTLEYIKMASRVIQYLVDDLCNGFDGFEWSESVALITEQMKLIDGADLPANLQTENTVIIPNAE